MSDPTGLRGTASGGVCTVTRQYHDLNSELSSPTVESTTAF